jgi:hypothetical protein
MSKAFHSLKFLAAMTLAVQHFAHEAAAFLNQRLTMAVAEKIGWVNSAHFPET